MCSVISTSVLYALHYHWEVSSFRSPKTLKHTINLMTLLVVLFQENQAGCWVARIFSSGSAAHLPNDSVIVGDQLAAIDGKVSGVIV